MAERHSSHGDGAVVRVSIKGKASCSLFLIQKGSQPENLVRSWPNTTQTHTTQTQIRVTEKDSHKCWIIDVIGPSGSFSMGPIWKDDVNCSTCQQILRKQSLCQDYD